MTLTIVAIYFAIGVALIAYVCDKEDRLRRLFFVSTPGVRLALFFFLCVIWFPVLVYSWFRFKEAIREQRKRIAGHHVGSEGKAVLPDVQGDNRGDAAKIQTRKRPRGKVPGRT